MEDRYTVEKPIGRGNYGQVYLVKSTDTGKTYVMKRINFEHMPDKDRQHTMLEVDMLKKMDHPNIVKYKDHHIDEHNLYIVMGYCEGGDLHAKIKQAQKSGVYFPEDQILKWFVQMALALSHVHSCKVIKLGDFGISKVLDGTIDMAKTVIGTPYYMSPELCESQPYGMKSDVWALGCILYEMCVLKHAFDATNICGLIFKILNGSYPPIGEQYSPELRNLVAKMLSRDPNDRPNLQEIVKMPIITRVMASLKEDLANGVKAKTPSVRRSNDRADRKLAAERNISTAPSAEGAMGVSHKEMVLMRKKKRQEDLDRKAREDLKKASLQTLNDRMKAKERQAKEFGTLGTGGMEAEAKMVEDPPQKARTVEEKVSGSLGQSGSSLEEELPEAAPIIDGHTLPRDEGEALVGAARLAATQQLGQAPAGERHVEEEAYGESEDPYESDDFEAYSSDFESDDEKVMEVMEQAEEARQSPATQPVSMPEAANAHESDYYRTKIVPLRQQCETALGKEKFAQVHAILLRKWNGDCTDEAKIKAELGNVVNIGDKSVEKAIFLVDQLLFCEVVGM